MSKPLILVSNDDGYLADGINVIAECAARYGDVVMVAPDGPRSAQSSALTIELPVRVKSLPDKGSVRRFAIGGTPADCVKLAINSLLDRKPDLVVSGINHGSNAGINVVYSGTIGAAVEGALHGIPAIGFSLCDHSADADFSFALPYYEKIMADTLVSLNSLPKPFCLNINAPKGPVKGVRVCRQARGSWENDFIEDNAPRTDRYFWMVGDFINLEDKSDIFADQCAIEEGFISVVPLDVDFTDYSMLDFCKAYEK